MEPSGTSDVWAGSSSLAERRDPRALSVPESSRAGAKRSQRPSEGWKAPSGRGSVSSRGRASSRGKSLPGGRAVSSPGKAFSGRRAAPSRERALSSREGALALRGRIAAATALRQVGRPYVWGGGSSAGPTGGGFDCSGLALHAWAKAGARLTHYTGTQFRQGGRVPFSRLRPGDLVFFGGGSGDPTHVGVYVKDGVMVHAPKTGDVVRTADFAASPYYLSRYRGAVRPTPR
ncbi:C40 family peptidase [Streptosporangium sp. OZ121]|uniref:C40 family peptidase n=1 Tax=Streptosporangium sp. OZ121 TaxID=3444183 RepID=UPI003F79CF6A